MSAQKNAPGVRKRKEKTPMQPASDPLRERRNAEREQWGLIRDSLREVCLNHEDLDAIQNKLSGTASVLKDLDRWDNRAPDPAYEIAVVDAATGAETIEHRAWSSVAMDSRTALNRLLRMTLDALLDVFEHSGGDETRFLFGSFTDDLLMALNAIKRLATDKKKRLLVQDEARKRVEFPFLISIFKKENTDYSNFVLKRLQLGAGLPFVIDPRKPYTDYTLLGMQIVQWIDSQRLHFWKKNDWRTSDSVYRKIDPNLDEKEFRQGNRTAWEKVIAFHLDYFQAPKERRKKTASECRLDAEYEQREADRSRMFGIDSFSPFGEIAKMRAFRTILESGRDSNVKSESELYNRVKHKVLTATLGLMPK
jgi:hypothetical protein